jgi:aspartyl-tRNA(Asn)/glutamyl-tRNA(Gln) amidotransferase subunit A
MLNDKPIHWLGVGEGLDLIAAGRLAPREWERALLERIRAINPLVNAFVQFGFETTAAGQSGLARLRPAEAGGLLDGVPLGIKDVIDTADRPTTGHSRVAIDRQPSVDAACVALLRGAGAVMLGKTATHEFAHGGPSLDLPWPPARNPWHLDHFTGSSSSGSGAAVAAGLVPAALGTDTGGSIRIPAGMCGVTGLKPTYGRVSRRGVLPLAGSLDTVGPMARSARDCALLLQVIAGFDPADPSSVDRPVPDYCQTIDQGIGGVRIGVVRHFWERDLKAHPDAVRGVESALGVLQGLGAHLCEVELAPLGFYNDVRVLVQEPEAFARYASDLRRRTRDFGRDFLGRILPGCLVPGHVQFQAMRHRERLVRQMRAAFDQVDLLVTLGPGPAPRLDAPRTHGFRYGLWGDRPNLTSPFSLTGLPALSVCTGFSSNGLPLSMQIVGRAFDESLVLRAGAAFEAATGFGERRPPIDGCPPPSPLRAPPEEPVAVADPATRVWVERMLGLAGLELDADLLALVHTAAPLVEAMIARIDVLDNWSDEPAQVFLA